MMINIIIVIKWDDDDDDDEYNVVKCDRGRVKICTAELFQMLIISQGTKKT